MTQPTPDSLNALSSYFNCSLGHWSWAEGEFSDLVRAVFVTVCDEIRTINSMDRPIVPHLVTIRSLFGNVEQLRAADTNFIIVDQHYFHFTMNLNLLLHGHASQPEIETYLFRLWAYRRLAQGDLTRAIELLVVHRESIKRLDRVVGKTPELAARLKKAHLIEVAIVISHELVHFYWANDEVFRTVSTSLYTQCMKAHEKTYAHAYRQLDASHIQIAVDDFLAHHGVRADDPEYVDVRQQMRDRFTREYEVTGKPFTSKLSEWASSDSVLFEELICDAMGLFYATRALEGVSYSASSVIAFGLTAMQQLGLIRAMDAEPGEADGVIHNALIRRVSLQRFIVGVSICYPVGDPVPPEYAHRHEWAADNLRYDRSGFATISDLLEYGLLRLTIERVLDHPPIQALIEQLKNFDQNETFAELLLQTAREV